MHDSLLEKLVATFTCLPGVGKKTAQRYIYYLLERDRESGKKLGEDLADAMEQIKNCKNCRMFTEEELCAVCTDDERDKSRLCVVESPADLAAIESIGNYQGLYFVLHGKLSPLDGIGPDEIGLDLLERILMQSTVSELILATSTTIEGDVTAHVICELARKYEIDVSQIAQGVPVGGELEYIDASTLSRAFDTRTVLLT